MGRNTSRRKSAKQRKTRKSYRANTKHKDTLFRRIFTCNKEWTLELYNAVNGTNYSNPDDIVFTTIEDAVYMGMKNDLSFLITETMNFYEHQSTYNPNMPLRMLIYAGMVYSSYADSDETGYNIYSSKTGMLPVPKLICFYNGEADKPESTVLKLSDAFKDGAESQSDIEVRVTMLNINYGHNKRLMEACRPLGEYSWFIEEIRTNQRKRMTLEDAVDQALNDMPDKFKIRSYLINNRSEVRRMCITEFDKKKVEKAFKREAEEERKRAEEERKRAEKAEGRAAEAENQAAQAENRAVQAENRVAQAENQASALQGRVTKAESDNQKLIDYMKSRGYSEIEIQSILNS